MARAARDELTDTAADAAIDQACRILRLPTIRDRHGEVAAAAARQQAGYKGFLVELLSIECDDRETAAQGPAGPRGRLPPPQAAGGLRLRRQPERARRADRTPSPRARGWPPGSRAA